MTPATAEGAINLRRALLLTVVLTSIWVAAQQSTAPTTSVQNPCSTTPGKPLAEVKRVYVDSFGDDPISREMQSMVITSLTNSRVFSVTENKGKADAILKGTTIEKTSQEAHSYSDATSVGVARGSVHGSVDGSSRGDLSGHFVDGTGTIDGSSTGSINGSINGSTNSTHMADSTSTSSINTVNDARASVRLVNSDDDVIWTTTQESKGAKYKGASADVADKIVKQLLWDVTKPSTPTK